MADSSIYAKMQREFHNTLQSLSKKQTQEDEQAAKSKMDSNYRMVHSSIQEFLFIKLIFLQACLKERQKMMLKQLKQMAKEDKKKKKEKKGKKEKKEKKDKKEKKHKKEKRDKKEKKKEKKAHKHKYKVFTSYFSIFDVDSNMACRTLQVHLIQNHLHLHLHLQSLILQRQRKGVDQDLHLLMMRKRGFIGSELSILNFRFCNITGFYH